jgi:putative membrane protein
MSMRFDGPGVFGLGTFLWILMWAAIVVLIVAVLVAAFRWLWRTADRQGGGEAGRGPIARPDDPLEILRGRYARGEIDDEEYERRRKILGG